MRRAILPVRPERAPRGLGVVLTLSLSATSLLALAALVALRGGPSPWQPTPAALTALHLLTLGFLAPVALAAATQLSAAVASPAAAMRSSWLLPLAWAGGVGVAAGLAHPGPLIAAGGATVALVALIVCAEVAARAFARPRSSLDLRVGMALGLCGLLATLAAGLVTGLRYAGLAPGAPPLALHLVLAAAAAFVPLLLAVSGQLFPMFARCPPLPTVSQRLGPVLLAAAGALAAAWGAGASSAALVLAGALASATAVSVRLVGLERAYRRRRGTARDPAAWAARWASAMLAAGAWGTVVALAGGPRLDGLLAAAVALVLVGGVAGSVVAYLRRVLPFALWNLLLRRFGHAPFLPKLDGLRPPVPLEVLPLLWTLGAAAAAWKLGGFGPAAGAGGWARAHGMWPLAIALALAGLELVWAPSRSLALLLAHHGEPARPPLPPAAPRAPSHAEHELYAEEHHHERKDEVQTPEPAGGAPRALGGGQEVGARAARLHLGVKARRALGQDEIVPDHRQQKHDDRGELEGERSAEGRGEERVLQDLREGDAHERNVPDAGREEHEDRRPGVRPAAPPELAEEFGPMRRRQRAAVRSDDHGQEQHLADPEHRGEEVDVQDQQPEQQGRHLPAGAPAPASSSPSGSRAPHARRARGAGHEGTP